MKCETCHGRFHRVGVAAFWSAFGLVVSLSLVSLVAALLTMSQPSGECYTEYDYDEFHLVHRIHWGRDSLLGSYPTLDALFDDAAKLKCPVTVTR